MVEMIELFINISEMKVVHLVLDAFRDRIIGENLVLKSDNAMVMVYLKKQGGILSLDMYRLAHKI